MAIEFEAFALNGHHCPIWAMDIMITLVSRGIMCAIQDSLLVGITPLTEKYCLIHDKALYRFKSLLLVILYQQFLGHNRPQGQRFESYFNLQSDITSCDGTL